MDHPLPIGTRVSVKFGGSALNATLVSYDAPGDCDYIITLDPVTPDPVIDAEKPCFTWDWQSVLRPLPEQARNIGEPVPHEEHLVGMYLLVQQTERARGNWVEGDEFIPWHHEFV